MKQRKQAIANVFAVIIVTMAFISCPTIGSGAVTWLQGIYSQSDSTVSSVSFNSKNTANSLLLCSVSCEIDLTTTLVPSGDVVISDSAGNSWAKLASAYDNYKIADGYYTWQYNSLFYADNTQGTGNQKIKVDIGNYYQAPKGSEGPWYCTVMIEEFAPPLNSWLVPDGTVYGFQNGTYTSTGTVTLTGPTITPNANDDLIYSILWDDASVSGYDTFTAGTGFDLLLAEDQSGVGNLADEYLIQGTASGISPSFGFSSTYQPEQWTILAAAFGTLCVSPLIQVLPSESYVTSIQEGIDSAGASVINVSSFTDTIEINNTVTFSNSVPISLQGGWDCSLQNIIGYTEIDGLVVINGTAVVTMGNIIIGP
jgi:hypothetical protein